MDYVEQSGIRIAKPLYEFVNDEALPGTSIDADVFWAGLPVCWANWRRGARRCWASGTAFSSRSMRGT